MMRFLVGRVLQTVLSMLVVISIVFVLTRLSGNPIHLLLDVNATERDQEILTRYLGLDQPLPVQYAIYVKNLARGDLGQSILSRRPVAEHIWERLPATVELGFVAMFLSVLIGVPLGVYSAVRRGGIMDGAARVFAVLGQSMPTFWLGLMLILFFGVVLGVLPAGGRGGLLHLILPAFTLGYFTSAAILRLTRSAMLEVLGSDYIKFARLKGLHEQVVLWKHGLKNALLPVVTFAVMLFVQFLGGAVVTETVFAWPGLGRLILESITTRDYPIVQAGVLVLSALYLTGNLFVDVLYSYLNPLLQHPRGARLRRALSALPRSAEPHRRRHHPEADSPGVDGARRRKPPARDRSLRTRRAQPGRPRQPHLADRVPRGDRRGGHARHGPRPDLRLPRRRRRQRADAADRHRAVAPDGLDRGRAGGGLRAELSQRHPGHCALALAALRAPDPWRDSGDQGAGLRRARDRGRTLERLDHPAAHLPQRGADLAGHLHPAGGLRDPPGGHVELSRRRCPAPESCLGPDDRRWPRVPGDGLVDLVLSGDRNALDGSGRQPDGRLAARLSRSKAQAGGRARGRAGRAGTRAGGARRRASGGARRRGSCRRRVASPDLEATQTLRILGGNGMK